MRHPCPEGALPLPLRQRSRSRSASRWSRSRALVALAAIAVLGAAGCGSDDAATTTTEASPSGSSRNVEPLEELTTVRRGMEPVGLVGDPKGQAITVAAGIEELWDDWGPTLSSAPDPPEVPEGHTIVALWNRGYYPSLHGWRIDDGALVLFGTSEVPGGNCVVPAVVDAHTVFAAINDERVVPGMPTAPPEIDVRTVDC